MQLLQRQGFRNLGRRLGGRAAVRLAARRLGYDLVKRHYYSEVPDLESLPPGTWTGRSQLGGVRFEISDGLQFVQRELAPFLSEFSPPLAPTDEPGRFYLNNTLYEGLDAETLYAMVRRFKPGRILELGSGMSTLVIAEARARNGTSHQSRHDVYDPYPRPDLRAALERVATLHAISANDVSLDEFGALGAGDFLFVDTTHTVKIGSDVNRVILDVLPRLAPGVIVHFHDIFLPWEYPIEFFTELGFSWAEQYLLQAFLAFNDEFHVLFGAAALQREFPREISALIPTAAASARPAAFWIRRAERSSR